MASAILETHISMVTALTLISDLQRTAMEISKNIGTPPPLAHWSVLRDDWRLVDGMHNYVLQYSYILTSLDFSFVS